MSDKPDDTPAAAPKARFMVLGVSVLLVTAHQLLTILNDLFMV